MKTFRQKNSTENKSDTKGGQEQYSGPMYGGPKMIAGHLPVQEPSESLQDFMRRVGGTFYERHIHGLDLKTAKDAFDFIKRYDEADRFTQSSMAAGHAQAKQELDLIVAELLDRIKTQQMEEEKLKGLRKEGILTADERFQKDIKPVIGSLLKEFKTLDTIPGFGPGELVRKEVRDILSRMERLLQPNSDGYLSFRPK